MGGNKGWSQPILKKEKEKEKEPRADLNSERNEARNQGGESEDLAMLR